LEKDKTKLIIVQEGEEKWSLFSKPTKDMKNEFELFKKRAKALWQ